MTSRSPSPMEVRNDSDDESGRSRNSSRGRSPTPMTGAEKRLRKENKYLRKANEAQEKRIKELQEQVKAMARQLLDQADEAERRHEELLRRLPIQEAQEVQKPQQKGKRKKSQAPGESGSEEEPTKLPRRQGKTQDSIDRTMGKPDKEFPGMESPETNKTPAETIKAAIKEDKIPPVILRNKERWTAVSKLLKEEGVNFTRARLTAEGISITPATTTDHRKLTKVLANKKEEYHTYSLKEERLLRVVMRGIPSGVPLEEVAEDLRQQGINPTAINRMRSRRTKQEMPLLLIQTQQDQQDILKVTRCCSLVVRVENQKASQETTQCHRCQKFGHGQSRCTAQVKCVKCGEGHHSAECKKSREVQAKCANCGGPHPASYRGCPSAPRKAPAKKTTDAAARQPAKSNPPPKVTAAKSFAEAARQRQVPAAAPEGARKAKSRSTDPADVASMLAQMREWYSAMSAFFNKMPSLLQE